MNEFIEKLIEMLEESKKVLEEAAVKEMGTNGHTLDFENYNGGVGAVKCVITLVKHLAEEHKGKTIIDGQYCWQTCGATEHCKECNRLFNGSIDYYENYDFMAEEYNGGWISVNDRLPEDGVKVLVTYIYENKLYADEILYRFDGDWYFGDVVDEMYYPSEVIAWQTLPETYNLKGE